MISTPIFLSDVRPPKTIKPYTRFEHIEVHTQDGPARLLVRRYYDASNVSGAAYGTDWWRTPEAIKMGRMHQGLAALLRYSKYLLLHRTHNRLNQPIVCKSVLRMQAQKSPRWAGLAWIDG